MKIKIAIVDNDRNYLDRMVSKFAALYYDKLEIYCFDNLEKALKQIQGKTVDLFLVGDSIPVDESQWPQQYNLVYLVHSNEIKTYKGKRTICRYQKAESIYKQILDIFSESLPNDVIFRRAGTAKAIFYAFTAVGGGAGVTSVAIAFAKYLASQRKKALYVSLDPFANPDLLLHGEGSYNFDDILFAIKRRMVNLSLKLESYIKQDPSGVDYFSASTNAMDMVTITKDDLQTLIQGLNDMNHYDYILFDMPFSFSKECMSVFNQADRVIFVSEGSRSDNDKFIRAFDALQVYVQQNDVNLQHKIFVFYNKFRKATCRVLEDNRVGNAGGISLIANAKNEQLIQAMVAQNAFDKLIVS